MQLSRNWRNFAASDMVSHCRIGKGKINAGDARKRLGRIGGLGQGCRGKGILRLIKLLSFGSRLNWVELH
uniref:Uncharacterized protein n=1 Tax=Rhizophora mucronata TaxID=61149 RepID=A0A2P2QC48_RHIMU